MEGISENLVLLLLLDRTLRLGLDSLRFLPPPFFRPALPSQDTLSPSSCSSLLRHVGLLSFVSFRQHLLLLLVCATSETFGIDRLDLLALIRIELGESIGEFRLMF